MTTRRWTLLLAASVLLLTAIGVLTAPGPTLAQDGPFGTLALERVASDLGFGISRDDQPRDGATFLLVRDFRAPEDAADLVAWASSGGRLVVADPDSQVLEQVGVRGTTRVSGAFSGTVVLDVDRCDLPETTDVQRLRLRAGDRRLQADDAAARTCTDAPGADPLVAVVEVGEGEVVLVGGATVFLNENLRDADNALFALRLLGDRDEVVLGSPTVGPPPTGFWASLPDRARALLVAGLLSAVVVVAAAWRRLGTPLGEPAPTPVGASTLLDAVAGLYRESGDRGHVARRLQAHLVEVVRRRSGLPPDAPTAEVSRVLADLTGRDPATTDRMLTTVPDAEDDLVDLALELHDHLTLLEAR